MSFFLGVEKLVKDITQEDLSEDELQMLYDGQENQICGVRDSAGRTVLFGRSSIGGTMTKLRFNWYFFHCLIFHDGPTAQLGAVVIGYTINNPDNHHNDDTLMPKIHHESPDRTHTWKIFKLVQSLPIKFASMHFCVENNNPIQKSLMNMVIGMLESRTLIRSRVHSGSHMEALHSLMSYGIPPEAIPIQADGTESPPYGHMHFFQEQRDREIREKQHEESMLERLLEEEQQELEIRQPGAADVTGANSNVEESLENQLVLLEDDEAKFENEFSSATNASISTMQMEMTTNRETAAINDDKDNRARSKRVLAAVVKSGDATTTNNGLQSEQEKVTPKRIAMPGPNDILLGTFLSFVTIVSDLAVFYGKQQTMPRLCIILSFILYLPSFSHSSSICRLVDLSLSLSLSLSPSLLL